MTAIVNKPSIPGVDFPFSTSAPSSSTSSSSSFSPTAAASSSGGYCKPSYWCNFAICPKKQKTDNNVPSADEYGAASSSVTNGARSLMSQTAQMVNRFQLHANLVKLSNANNNNSNHNNANHNSDNNPNNSMNSPPSIASTTTMSPRSQDSSMFIPIVNTPLTSAIEKNQDQTMNNNNHHRHSSTFPNNIACHEDEFIHVPLQTPLRVNNDNNLHGENEEKYNNENEYENDSGYAYQQDDDDDIDALPGSETPDLENFDDDDDDDVDVDVDLGNSMGSLQISQQLPQQSMCSPEQDTPIIPSDDNENDHDNGNDNNNDNGEVNDAVVSRVGNNDIHSHIIDDYADSRSVVEHRANDDDDFVMVADEQDANANQREIFSPDDYDDLP